MMAAVILSRDVALAFTTGHVCTIRMSVHSCLDGQARHAAPPRETEQIFHDRLGARRAGELMRCVKISSVE